MSITSVWKVYNYHTMSLYCVSGLHANVPVFFPQPGVWHQSYQIFVRVNIVQEGWEVLPDQTIDELRVSRYPTSPNGDSTSTFAARYRKFILITCSCLVCITCEVYLVNGKRMFKTFKYLCWIQVFYCDEVNMLVGRVYATCSSSPYMIPSRRQFEQDSQISEQPPLDYLFGFFIEFLKCELNERSVSTIYLQRHLHPFPQFFTATIYLLLCMPTCSPSPYFDRSNPSLLRSD